jgi:hypothetical protein
MIGSALKLVAGGGAPAPKVAKSMLGIAKESVGRRVRPASAETVVRNIKKRAPEIRKNYKQGFSYDPVNDRFLSRQSGDVGTMMAVRPELKIGDRNVNEVGNLTAKQIDRLFSENPQMLEDLRRGAMFGGWKSDRGFIVDGSRRYGSTYRAKRKGKLTKQDEGFNLATLGAVAPYGRYTPPPSLAALGIMAGDTEVR